jgi:hypothetical protein
MNTVRKVRSERCAVTAPSPLSNKIVYARLSLISDTDGSSK